MLLLLSDAILLIFITFGTGKLTKRLLSAFFRVTIKAGFFDEFLLGLIACSVYFNIVSFFVPVNYLVLIPVFILSMGWWYKEGGGWLSHLNIRFKEYFGGQYKWLLFFVLGVILVYCFIPPVNHDSADYHYHAVYWYENEKVIPGLANVHGRLGFNAIVFILSAPYAFSKIVGQSIYPLNGVLVAMFYTWLLSRVISRKGNWSSIAYIVAGIFLFRPLLANVPSPASEPLVIISVFFVFFRLIELRTQEDHKDPAGFIIPFIVSFFAICAKLTSLPILLIPAIWIFILPRQAIGFYVRSVFVIGPILVPWLARNVILSGYLLYPLYQLDLFSVDWKVPKNVAVIDYSLGTYGCKGFIVDVLKQSGRYEWFLPWLKTHFQPKKWIDLVVFTLCFSSPVLWYFSFKIKKIDRYLFVFWACAFLASLVWLLTAPEYRFGMSFLVLSFVIPLINLGDHYPLAEKRFRIFSFALVGFFCLYYAVRSVAGNLRFHTIGIESIWLRPMKDKRYYRPTNMSDFPKEELGNGVVLYFNDKDHDCINIQGQPCMLWNYGSIEMRGKTLADGFRNKKDESAKNHPWVFVREW